MGARTGKVGGVGFLFVIASAWLAPAASATAPAQVVPTETQMTYTAAPGHADRISIANEGGQFVVRGDQQGNDATLAAFGNCSLDSPTQASCPAAPKIVINFADGGDLVTFNPAQFPATTFEVDGGPGADTLQGGGGADILRARDGEADQVTCGGGTDLAEVDDLDTVAADCETVQRPDADGDGVLDSSDRCGQLPGPGPSGCPAVKRTLGLSQRNGRIRGVLRAPTAPRCARNQSVQIFKVKPGRDRQVVSVRTRRTGRFGVGLIFPRGRYYAKVAPKLIPDVGNCSAARSRTITVR